MCREQLFTCQAHFIATGVEYRVSIFSPVTLKNVITYLVCVAIGEVSPCLVYSLPTYAWALPDGNCGIHRMIYDLTKVTSFSCPIHYG
jgi:hypothetical protein